MVYKDTVTTQVKPVSFSINEQTYTGKNTFLILGDRYVKKHKNIHTIYIKMYIKNTITLNRVT